jgi:Xaa-Pro dipeptidase
MELIFSKNALEKRQNLVATKLKQVMRPGQLLLIYSGSPITKPGGLDQQYHFLPQPEYLWLAGTRRAGGCLVFSNDEGFIHFPKNVSTEEIVWEGASPFCSELDISDLPTWIQRKNVKECIIIGCGPLSGSKLASDELALNVKEVLDQCRRPKDEEEIVLIQAAAHAAAKGYERLRSYIKPGCSEREIQIEFDYQTFLSGSHKAPYETIVGTGDRSAILHAVPTERRLKAGELVLIDGGADISDYCVDITRVFFADGKPSNQQKDIFEIVLKAQRGAISTAKPGVEWHDCHRAAAQVIAQGLKDLNIFKGSLEQALESGAIGMFFPHGVGHMLGQRVRDVGGAQRGRLGRKVYGTGVRVDLPLEENFLMTFEPGLYFIKALLENPENQKKYSEIINFDEVEKWKSIGGIRLEDDVLIKAEGNINLTAAIPQKL